MGRCFFCAVVSVLQGRFMLAEPAIRGIRSTVGAFLLDSPHLLAAYEDCSGAISWMSFDWGAVVFPSLAACGFQGIWTSIFGSDMPR